VADRRRGVRAEPDAARLVPGPSRSATCSASPVVAGDRAPVQPGEHQVVKVRALRRAVCYAGSTRAATLPITLCSLQRTLAVQVQPITQQPFCYTFGPWTQPSLYLQSGAEQSQRAAQRRTARSSLPDSLGFAACARKRSCYCQKLTPR
jgi:hypothetical protein